MPDVACVCSTELAHNISQHRETKTETGPRGPVGHCRIPGCPCDRFRWAGWPKPIYLANEELYAWLVTGVVVDRTNRHWAPRETISSWNRAIADFRSREALKAAGGRPVPSDKTAVEVLQEASKKAKPCPRCEGKGFRLVYPSQKTPSQDDLKPLKPFKQPCQRCDSTGTDFKVQVYGSPGSCPTCQKREDPVGRCHPGAPLTKMLPFRECEACGTVWLEKPAPAEPEKKEEST